MSLFELSMSADHNEMVRKIEEIDQEHKWLVERAEEVAKSHNDTLNNKKFSILLERIANLEDRLDKAVSRKDVDNTTICFEQRIADLEKMVLQHSENALKSNEFQTKSQGNNGSCKCCEDVAKLESRLDKAEILEKEGRDFCSDLYAQIRHVESQMKFDITAGFEDRIDELEKTVFIQRTLLDYLREDATKNNDFETTTNASVNTLFRTIGQIERKQELANEQIALLKVKNKKHEDNHFILTTNIDTLFRANVDRNNDHKKFAEKANLLLAEHVEDIIRLQNTLTTYKQDNTMLENRFHDFSAGTQRIEDGLDYFRLKLIDISDETEKNTSETAEIKKMASQVLYKNKEYEQVFAMVMGRMNELEEAMKTVTVHKSSIVSISERLDALETTCIFCDETAEMKHDGYDCCINCHVSMTLQ